MKKENLTEINEVATQPRYKSWAVWLSVFGAIGVILNSLGVFDCLGLTSTEFDVIINAVGSILVAFGILNNPTDKEHF